MNLAKVRGKRKKGLIFVISGPSGSGKTTLAKKILNQPQFKGKFIKSVSFTTRPKRPGERQGRDYIFVSAEEFQRLLKGKKILEHTRYLGYDYGTPSMLLEQSARRGLHIILCLDLKGASFVKRAYPARVVTIFIKPLSLSIVEQRILKRWAETGPEELDRRVQLASKELSCVDRYDYCLVNDNLNKAVKEIKGIIQAEVKA
jgi:guanylate kinase